MANSGPIGVFDSGIGGLTVLKALIEELPHENFVYLGDTARIPYGARGKDIITKFALQLVEFLMKQNPKALVVACNTISATCFQEIEAYSPVPVMGVIDNTVNEAIRMTRTNHIGVIGTKATISSGKYVSKVLSIRDSVTVTTKACPLFVPLAEEGLLNHRTTQIISDEYLLEYKDKNIDTLILGCTHYPLLTEVIQESVGKDVHLIDSAYPTARELKFLLKTKGLLNTSAKKTKHRFFVTDEPDISRTTVELFFENQFPGKLEKAIIESKLEKAILVSSS